MATSIAKIVIVEFSVAETKNNLPKLIKAVEQGEAVRITRFGKVVAELVSVNPVKKPVKLGTLKGTVKLNPGWDDPLPLTDWDVLGAGGK